jgi:hypothetical protein
LDTSCTAKTAHSKVHKAAPEAKYPAKSRFDASETMPKMGGTQMPPIEVTVFLKWTHHFDCISSESWRLCIES